MPKEISKWPLRPGRARMESSAPRQYWWLSELIGRDAARSLGVEMATLDSASKGLGRLVIARAAERTRLISRPDRGNECAAFHTGLRGLVRKHLAAPPQHELSVITPLRLALESRIVAHDSGTLRFRLDSSKAIVTSGRSKTM
jgi:hypothetical protein